MNDPRESVCVQSVRALLLLSIEEDHREADDAKRMILEIGLRLFHFSFFLSRTVPCPSKCNVQIRRLRLSSSSSYRHFARDDPGKAKASHIAMTLQLNRQQKNAITWSRPVRPFSPSASPFEPTTDPSEQEWLDFFLPILHLFLYTKNNSLLFNMHIAQPLDFSTQWSRLFLLEQVLNSRGPFFSMENSHPFLSFLFYYSSPIIVIILYNFIGTGHRRTAFATFFFLSFLF